MTDRNKADQFVYISCVDEVRYSFVSHLSDALRRNGISVYVDPQDLLSEEAQENVERARVSVVVLPANRKVCLEKLEKVLNCQRNKDQVLVPVLYGDSKLNGEWLSAMSLRGLSPVYQSRNENSDSELVEDVVRNVREKLFLYMGRIGIYSKLREIDNMVCKQPLGIRCVGIWGMPGIGKTTLAEAFFRQVSSGFDACCFIGDFDKAVHENRLYHVLVEQFMKDQPGKSGTITKLRLRRDKLKNKRVLLVLDDVRNPLAAESFLEEFEWFGPESLIIITSSDKQVFRHCRINQIYEVPGLSEKESRQLFVMCASINDMDEHNLHEVITEVIKYANGNPLALSIYGGALKGKETPTEMETALHELKKNPPCKLVDAIKRSYDTLNNSENNIFLDIACFFQGENVDYVMQLLEGCGFFPLDGINVLVEKCMVSISENRMRMHNLIQDFGQEIISGETVPIKRRSRQWEPQRRKYLLEDNEHKADEEPKRTFQLAQGTEEIEGMFLDTSYLNLDIKPAAFVNMLNLRLLKIYCSNPEIHPVINYPKNFPDSLPNELRLLHWENYPLEFLPQNFDPRHLVEINMPYSQLQKLWGGTKNLEMLRTVRLCKSQKLIDIDDLLKAKNIEIIDLQGCTSLQSFPATGQLIHLRVVNLSGCTEIKSLQAVPPNIETLNLQGTGITELPLSIVKPNGGELMSLLAEIDGLSDALKLERLESLKKSSSSCQDLGKLFSLELKDCSCLRSLPNMVNLQLLTVLDLSGCSKLESIQGFPRNLKELYLSGTAVRKVPQLPQRLELLNAHGCLFLESIPLDPDNLPMHYTFTNCFNLSPQVINDFLVKVLDNVKYIPRALPQELKEAPDFSFCSPSHANKHSTLDLQLGSSVMTRLNPSLRNTFVGFAMMVEVAFSGDYNDANGFDISCVCRWKNEEGHSHKIERNLHCWDPWKAVPKVEKDHMFVFCDVNMRPSTNIFGDLVVFEFFPVNKQKKRLDDTCTVTRCGVYVITAPTGNTSLEDISPVLYLDPMDCSGDEGEGALKVSYGLVRTNAIRGPLGIGKTATARRLYNQVSRVNFSTFSDSYKGSLRFLKFNTNLLDKEVNLCLSHGYRPVGRSFSRREDVLSRCMPYKFSPKYLVELTMVASKLEELWSGIQPLESLKSMNLRGSLDLREIPDLTRATSLETLNLGWCSSLTDLPSSVRNLHKLKDLDMECCIHLEVLPTDINLESLYCLNLNGCSRLRSFPQISRNISDLYLDGTAIEEVPGWIEEMHGLATLSMTGCNKLKKISPNISKLKHLVEVDFSQCKALTEESWQNHPEGICASLMRVNMSGNSFERLPDTWTSIQPNDLDIGSCRNLVSLPKLPSLLSNLKANHCRSLESLYGSFQQRQLALQFINCFKLNHQARELILLSDCAYAILPGEELPSYFTHRVDGNFLTVPLPPITLSRKILSFKACIVVEPRLCWFDFGVNWFFRGGTDTKYFSLNTNIRTKTNHLIIFGFEFSSDEFSDHLVELNNDDVQFDLFCLDHKKDLIKIKECGIQLLNDSRKRLETEDDDKSGENEAEASRSRKQMRIT